MANPDVRPGEQHPQPWRNDLNPDAIAGQNRGVASHVAEYDTRTAYDAKNIHQHLSRLRDDVLQQIPVLAPGTRLKQGATYIDLQDPLCHEFTATGDMEAERGNWYVAKNEVDYQLWNLLIGVENPERLGTGNLPGHTPT